METSFDLQALIQAAKLKLTDLSQRNRALRLAKLSSDRDLDLWEAGWMEGEATDKLLRKIITKKPVTLLKKFHPDDEHANLLIKRLLRIYRTLNTILEETGSYDLYVGYPFVEGRFLDGTVTRCPVLLFPVELVRVEGTGWQLRPRQSDNNFWNVTFFRAYQKFNNVKIPAAFWESTPEEDFSDTLAALNWIYDTLKLHQISVFFQSELFSRAAAGASVVPFSPYTKVTLDNLPLGTLKFTPNAVVGIFPQADTALLADYRTIETERNLFETLPFWHQPPLPQSVDYYSFKGRFPVLPADYSQTQAVRHVSEGRSVVVHGPPGTGKSQTLVNLAAQALGEGKRVLIVSQKRAALDVVYKRLAEVGLGRFATLIHDYRNDRNAVYAKLVSRMNELDVYAPVHSVKSELNAINAALDNVLEPEAKRLSCLHTPQPCGLTPFQLYSERPVQLTPQDWVITLSQTLTFEGLKAALTKIKRIAHYRDFYKADYELFHRPDFAKQTTPANYRTLLNALLAAVRAVKPVIAVGYHDHNFQLDNPELPTICKTWLQLSETLRRQPTCQRLFIQQPTNILQAFKALYQQAATLPSYLSPNQLDFLKHWHQTWIILKTKPLRLFYPSWHKHKKAFFILTQGKYSAEHVEYLAEALAKYQSLEQQFIFLRSQNPFWSDTPSLLSDPDQQTTFIQAVEAAFIWYESYQAFTAFADQRPKSPADFEAIDRFFQNKMEAFEQYHTFLQTWQPQLPPFVFHQLKQHLVNQDNPEAYITKQLELLARDGEALADLDKLVAALNPVETALYQHLMPLWLYDNTNDWQEYTWDNFYAAWLLTAETQNPLLRRPVIRGFLEEITALQSLYQNKLELDATFLQQTLTEKQLACVGKPAWRELRYRLTQKRQIWPLRKLITTFWENNLASLMPCVLASPETVSALFEMVPGLFDVVIFDEASQCPAERGIPAMLRGKAVLIAGDEQQLPPLTLFTTSLDPDPDDEDNAPPETQTQSLLRFGRLFLPELWLDMHYRSQDRALIAFSNQHFYNNRLQFVPRPSKPTQPPIVWLSCEGRWENNRNLPEAKTVVQLVLHLLTTEPEATLGVVTFNFHQQQAILDGLDAHLTALYQAGQTQAAQQFEALRTKHIDGAFVGLFVKNIENVQGDERDIIIFSTGYAPDEHGKLTANYGLLTVAGGENRLNVAVTRAKKRLYVVCSFNPDHMTVDKSKNDGPKLFQAYLRYARAVATAPLQELTAFCNNPMPAGLAERAGRKLVLSGMVPIYPDGRAFFNVDVIGFAEDKPPVAVLCEGLSFGRDSEEALLTRPRILQQLGWEVRFEFAKTPPQ